MAAALMKSFSEKDNLGINVISRGLSVFENSPASENSVEALKKYDIDLTNHYAKALTFEEINSSDLILTMSENHKNMILSAVPECKDKVFTLYEFAFGESCDILDPFGGSFEIYAGCLDEIYKCVKEIIDKNKLNL